MKLDGGAGLPGCGLHGTCRSDYGPLVDGDAGLRHDDGGPIGLGGVGVVPGFVDKRLEVATNDLLVTRLPTNFIVHNAIAGHVYSHVGRGLVRGSAGQSLQHAFEQGKCLNIPVIVHGLLAVGGEVKMVDDIGIVQVHGSGLVGQIHRMFQRQVPNGERLKLGVAGVHTPAVLVIHLAEAGGELPRTRPRRGHDHQVTGGFGIFVAAESFGGND